MSNIRAKAPAFCWGAQMPIETYGGGRNTHPSWAGVAVSL
jgi:hypothetical protein